MNNRGRNNNRGRRTPLNVRGQLQMLKSSLHGHENHLRATNPPPFNRKPFNTIVVEELLSGTPDPSEGKISPLSSNLKALVSSGNITVKSIIKALQDQLDIATCKELMIKVQRIDLWSISTTGILPTIRGEFFSLSTQISGAVAPQIRVNSIKFLEDVGVPGESAALVSYSFPRDQADIPLSVGTAPNLNPLIVSWKSDDENLKVFARYHLHWNTGNKVIEG